MPKKLTRSTIISEAGIALINRRVSEMGFVWHDRRIDAGIDGEIELRHPETGVMLNLILLAQSKASHKPFPSEDEDGFHFICEKDDIDYWLGGNAPVILVCSHPETQEAWWKSVKDWFADPQRREGRSVEFDKADDLFDKSAVPRLLDLGLPASAGVHIGPPPRREELVSNLLSVEYIAPKIFAAPARFASPAETREHMHTEGKPVSGWVISGGQIFSLVDLSSPRLNQLCGGDATSFPTDDWSTSDEPVVLRNLVRLLNATVEEIYHRELRWHNRRKHLYFRATENLSPRRVRGAGRRSRIVFQSYDKKGSPGEIAYYRHEALRRQFVRFDDRWYLELSPTYHYTYDGKRESHYAADYLKKIKLREKNAAVRGQVEMWARYLRGEATLLQGDTAEPLKFGDLVRLDIDRGVDDDAWIRRRKEAAEAAAEPQTDSEPPTLFEPS